MTRHQPGCKVLHNPDTHPCFDGFPWPYNTRKAQNTAHAPPPLSRQDATVGQDQASTNGQKADPQHDQSQKA